MMKVWNLIGSYVARHTWLHMILLSIPVLLVYSVTLIQYPLASLYGDGDTFYAMSEAARKIILDYHQFPWWNPWIGGGIPLYADPQFGLFSIHMTLILLFGSALGWKIALIVYILIGVYGLRKLLKDVIGTPNLTASLLAVTWGVSWFWLSRASMGHFTFFAICFLPWMLLLYFNRSSMKHAWIKLGLLFALTINTAFHYFTVISFLVFGLFVLADLLWTMLNQSKKVTLGQRLKNIVPAIKFLSLTASVAVPLSLHRIYSSYVISEDYSRVGIRYPEAFSGFETTFNLLFGLHVPGGEALRSTFSSQEGAAGIGIGSFVVALFVLVTTVLVRHGKNKPTHVVQNNILLTTLAATFFIIACGDFISHWSPYDLLRHLPFFNQTRVSVRWLILVAFMVLLLIGNYRDRPKLGWDRKVINTALATNIVFLTFTGTQFMNNLAPHIFQNKPPQVISHNKNTVPTQISLWHAPRASGPSYDENLFNATLSNVDQIDTSLLPYYNTPADGTDICDETKDKSCTFIQTSNATLTTWSPNEIILERTSSGHISLNMSPGKYWTVNGKYAFGSLKSSSLNTDFLITDPSSHIVLRYAPTGSVQWLEYR